MNKTAIILESRKHQALHFVIENICKNLDQDWIIKIFCGHSNETFCKSIASKINNRDISVINIGLPEILTLRVYNGIMCNKKLYNFIPTNTFLVFQVDSMINSNNKNYINEFLKYDYVGAPWKAYQEVGNGGFSLRKKINVLKFLNKIPYKDGVYEDRYFSLTFDKPYSEEECRKYKRQISLNKPTLDQAKRFSVETIFHDDFFAVHKPWQWNNESDLNILKQKCPDLDRLIELQ